MPKLDNFDQVQESTAGDFTQFDPGVYMCSIQAVRTEWTDSQGKEWTADDKQYVKLILDIAEGENAGRFSDDYWAGDDKDWGHTLFMSWKDTALGMLKHTFSALDEANKGFDAQAAFEADKWELFIGKKLLVVWRGEEYTGNNGMTKVRVRPDRAVTTDDNPKVTVELQDGSKCAWEEYKAKPAEVSTTVANDGVYTDVPF